MSGKRVDFRNVQAIVTNAYRCPIARHLLFHFCDRDGARAFLRQLGPRITMADFQFDSTPDPLLNVGITFPGLTVLGIDDELLREFDAVYRTGPEGKYLGDVRGTRSDPATWWEGQFSTEDVHCVVHVSVRSDAALEDASDMVRRLAQASQVEELAPRKDGTVLDVRSLGGGRLHFGYVDGISHPEICWDDIPDTPTEINFRHFLLGYATAQHSSAPEKGPAADLVRDSTYGALRWIYQDVAAFERFSRTEGPRLFPDLPSPDAAELLAAKMMGRWRDGTPLVLSPDGPDPGMARRNDFTYQVEDPNGHRCPFSAHIRVMNPRDQPLDSSVIEGVPRVIRRGMPYGPVLNSTEDDGIDRGLVGIFLCADIRRQVYILTGWIKKNDFSPVYGRNRKVQDAVVANRHLPGADPQFAIPSADGGVTIKELPDFVHTKGTLFLLYPSASMLSAVSGAVGVVGSAAPPPPRDGGEQHHDHGEEAIA